MRAKRRGYSEEVNIFGRIEFAPGIKVRHAANFRDDAGTQHTKRHGFEAFQRLDLKGKLFHGLGGRRTGGDQITSARPPLFNWHYPLSLRLLISLSPFFKSGHVCPCAEMNERPKCLLATMEQLQSHFNRPVTARPARQEIVMSESRFLTPEEAFERIVESSLQVHCETGDQ